ncbi:MAG: tRNA (N(6)-L-threonylcarbamoyladenosine(37)-C(2))-methylthiotransferase MtaB [Candidatus Zixiibacteriota bacterium]
MMKKVALETIGCRLNQYETEKIAAQLVESGFERVEFDSPADLYIINTCTVTGRADASCRNIISRAARQDHNPPVVVVGCYVDADPEKVARLNGVDLIVNNRGKEKILDILQHNYPDLFSTAKTVTAPRAIAEFHQHNRAWIKIGDGCNQRCAYCIIPLVRGHLTNRPAQEIIDEINLLHQHGYNEIVLTGVHIGQYKYEDIGSPGSLVRYILEKTAVPRIRLSSIEPQEVNEDLVAAMSDGGKRVCRHLHIPLQSGSDRILRLMNRPYNSAKYLKIVENAKSKIENIVIGADIIVGFPDETDDDFRRSVEAAESGLLDYLHVFSYSDRPNTPASAMPDKINPEVIKERNSILRNISKKHYISALKREIGRTAYVISEHRARRGDFYWGITDNYLKVALPVGLGGGKEILKMHITGANQGHLTAQLCD